MKQIRTIQDIKKLGCILSIWAHPDDESYLAAGIMTSAISNGQTVVCATATKGEAGSQDSIKWPAETLGSVREKELISALKELGITKHHWLGYQDGYCSEVDESNATQQLTQLIETYSPDTILTFGPEGLTGHPDHKAVSGWVTTTVKKYDHIQVYHAVHTFSQYNHYLKKADQELNIFFNIDKPPLVEETDCDINFELPHVICEKKCSAIAAMPSQTDKFFELFGREYIKCSFSSEYFIKTKLN